jgi:hypothetical protein
MAVMACTSGGSGGLVGAGEGGASREMVVARQPLEGLIWAPSFPLPPLRILRVQSVFCVHGGYKERSLMMRGLPQISNSGSIDVGFSSINSPCHLLIFLGP